MWFPLLYLCCGLLGLCGAPLWAATLPAMQHAQHEAQRAAQHGQPLVLLVSLPSCQFCERVRRDNLQPLSRSAGAVVREIEIGNGQPLRDFAGQLSTQNLLAKSLGARVAPTVYFLDAQGKPLAEPLVGASLPDFYGSYLQQRLAQAQQSLRSRP